MLPVWIVYIVELLLFFIFKPYIDNHELFSVILISINIPFVFHMIGKYQKKVFVIMFLGFFIRLFFMFWDIYGKRIFPLPHSGGDSERFLSTAIEISNNLSLLNISIYGGAYSKILGIVYFLGPVNRMIGQYLNVLLGISTVVLIWKVMQKLKLRFKVKMISLTVAAFFPSAIIFSSIFLREALTTFLVVLSFYLFINWYKTNKIAYFIFSVIILLCGSWLHSGIIGVLVGYVFMLLFYSHSKNQLKFTFKSSVIFTVIAMGIIQFNVISLDSIPFLNKFTSLVEDTEDFYEIASGSGRGGAAYLTGLITDSPIEIILHGPIKMFYFISSPLPLDWRSVLDVVTFMFDGLIYFSLFSYVILNYKSFAKGDPLIIGMFIMLMTTVFIFGIGVNNAGTAMRHRYKIFYLLFIQFLIIFGKKKMIKDGNKKETIRYI